MSRTIGKSVETVNIKNKDDERVVNKADFEANKDSTYKGFKEFKPGEKEDK